MHHPKFSAGELVRVDSQDQPHRNGIFTVVEIKYGKAYNPIRKCWMEGVGYKTDDEGNHQWAESALRKIYPPGEDFWRFMDKALGEPVDVAAECLTSVPELGQ